MVAPSTRPMRCNKRWRSMERTWFRIAAEGWVNPVFPPGPTRTSPGAWRVGEMRTDGGDDGNGAVLVRDVVLDDDRWPGLLGLVASAGIEINQIDVASSGERHFSLDRTGFRPWRDSPDIRDASSSSGNQSAAIARSRCAFASASAFRRAQIPLAFNPDQVHHGAVNEPAPGAPGGHAVKGHAPPAAPPPETCPTPPAR